MSYPKGVDKGLAEKAARDLISGRRTKAVLLGILAVLVGVAIFYFSVDIANRLIVYADKIVAGQASLQAKTPDYHSWIQYAVWGTGGALVAYGSNKIRRG